MPKIIHKSQSAFIKGRELFESIVVANEAVEGCRRKKRESQ